LKGSLGALLLGNGDGTFQPAIHINLPGPRTEKGSPIIGDFNSDGLLDFGIGVGGTEVLLQQPQ